MVEKLEHTDGGEQQPDSRIKQLFGKHAIHFERIHTNEAQVQQQKLIYDVQGQLYIFEVPEPIVSDQNAQEISEEVERLLSSPTAQAAWYGKSEEVK